MSLIKRNTSQDLDLWGREIPFFQGLERLQREMNRAFDGFFRSDAGDQESFSSRSWYPNIDVVENDDAYEVRAELPGLEKEDVKISLNNNVLTLRGEKKNEAEKKGANYHRIERSFGGFERSFTLPGSVKSEAIEAKFADGVLSVVIPKLEESKPKMIDIRVK